MIPHGSHLPPPTPHGCFGILLGAPAHGPMSHMAATTHTPSPSMHSHGPGGPMPLSDDLKGLQRMPVPMSIACPHALDPLGTHGSPTLFGAHVSHGCHHPHTSPAPSARSARSIPWPPCLDPGSMPSTAAEAHTPTHPLPPMPLSDDFKGLQCMPAPHAPFPCPSHGPHALDPHPCLMTPPGPFPCPLSPPPPPAPPAPWPPCPQAPCPQPRLQLMAPGSHMAATTHTPLPPMHVSHGPVAPCPYQMTLKGPNACPPAPPSPPHPPPPPMHPSHVHRMRPCPPPPWHSWLMAP